MYTKALVAAFAASALAAVIEVEVGESGLEFSPNTVTAQPGDSVAFILYPVHNVVSGSHSQPCIYNETSGFFSGTPDFDSPGPANERFVVEITDNEPIWFFCAISGHCQDGMVGVINAPAGGDTLTEYMNGATSASRATAPDSMTGGQLLDAAGVAALSGGSPSATPSAAESTAAESSAAESSAAESSAAQSSDAQTTAAESSPAMTSRPPQSSGAPQSSSAPPPASTNGAAFENPQAVGSSTVLAFIAGVAAWFL